MQCCCHKENHRGLSFRSRSFSSGYRSMIKLPVLYPRVREGKTGAREVDSKRRSDYLPVDSIFVIQM